MNHPNDDALLVAMWDEPGADAERAHLAGCATCRERVAALRAVLDAAGEDVPERGPDYGAQVWARLAPQLPARPVPVPAPPRRLVSFHRFASFGALAASLLAAFLIGRHTAPLPPPVPVVETQVRERVLLVAVGDHLERSRVLLVEWMNEAEGGAPHGAEELLRTNRLYRASAERGGDADVADVLLELERTLLEIARAPEFGPAERAELQARIERRGTLFKVRVLGEQVRQRQARPAVEAPVQES
ncbi:MAG: hypothetical protein NDJ94_00150 [Vicinamibacteria bacterium]|nr:hypothetical protein [Vicinamibacteria bacterium]